MKNRILIWSHHIVSAMALSHRTYPSFISAMSSRLGLSEMCAARHDVVQVACGCAAHTVFAVPVAPQMFRCMECWIWSNDAPTFPRETTMRRKRHRGRRAWRDLQPRRFPWLHMLCGNRLLDCYEIYCTWLQKSKWRETLKRMSQLFDPLLQALITHWSTNVWSRPVEAGRLG